MNRRSFFTRVGFTIAGFATGYAGVKAVDALLIEADERAAVRSGFSHIDDGRKKPEFKMTTASSDEGGYFMSDDTSWMIKEVHKFSVNGEQRVVTEIK